jgi:dsRNA-specific ribonuclease
MYNEEEKVIVYGSRGEDFKKLILSVLRKGKIKEHYIEYLMNEESMKIYDAVFTSSTADENNNYEVYEQMGDVLAGSFIIWYMYRRFPKLQTSEAVKIVARLKINYGSKNSFFPIAEKLGFWNFITASEEKRNREKKPLLEDTLEAFIGATAFILDSKIKEGVGYAIVYEILKSIFDEMSISLKYENLYDSITRLKEIFDYFKPDVLGVQEKKFSKEEKLTTFIIYQNFRGRITELGRGVAATKPDAEQKAATFAIETLRRSGYFKPVPELYLKYSS